MGRLGLPRPRQGRPFVREPCAPCRGLPSSRPGPRPVRLGVPCVCVCVWVSRRPWLHCHSRSSLSWWLLSCSASSYTKPRHGHTRVYKKRVTRSVQHYLQFRRPLGGPQCPPRMGAAAVSCGAQPNGRSAVLCRACVPVCTCSRATACAHAQDSWRPAASLCRAPARPPGPGQPRRSLSLLSTVPAKASLRAPLPQDPALIM